MPRTESRAYKDARAEFKQACADAGLPCWLCHQAIDYDAAHDDYGNDDRFQLDHFYPWQKYPELRDDPANFRPSHAGCNRARGDRTVTSTLAGTLSRDWTGDDS